MSEKHTTQEGGLKISSREKKSVNSWVMWVLDPQENKPTPIHCGSTTHSDSTYVKKIQRDTSIEQALILSQIGQIEIIKVLNKHLHSSQHININ